MFFFPLPLISYKWGGGQGEEGYKKESCFVHWAVRTNFSLRWISSCDFPLPPKSVSYSLRGECSTNLLDLHQLDLKLCKNAHSLLPLPLLLAESLNEATATMSITVSLNKEVAA